MRIRSVEAIPVRLPRDFGASQGTAGTPTAVTGKGAYRWSTDYPVLYSVNFETALVRVTTTDGLVGWGESQAPLAPEVPCAIIDRLLGPVLEGEEFDPSAEGIAVVYDRLYSTMRVRGQTGGFMLDAIAGIDLALWDLAGKAARMPVAQMLGATRDRVPAYLSGVSGATDDERIAFARRYETTAVKIYYGSDWDATAALAARLRTEFDVAIDALWHFDPARAAEIDPLGLLWLECPYMPEEIAAHLELAAAIRTPIALGESYRTPREVAPLLTAARILQPDLGRCGLTGALRIAALGREIVPHVSISMSPQYAAAVHLSAKNATQCEYNPTVLETANRFTVNPLQIQRGTWVVPDLPGLGVDIMTNLL